MDDLRQARIATNELRFREMNEQILDRVDEMGAAGDGLTLLCECAGADCESMLQLQAGEYARIRSNPRWFGVCPKHVLDEVEHVVEQHDGWWLIEKLGHAGAVAEAQAGD